MIRLHAETFPTAKAARRAAFAFSALPLSHSLTLKSSAVAIRGCCGYPRNPAWQSAQIAAIFTHMHSLHSKRVRGAIGYRTSDTHMLLVVEIGSLTKLLRG